VLKGVLKALKTNENYSLSLMLEGRGGILSKIN
jgi:hypothetical protein